jgi:hypothetical protein
MTLVENVVTDVAGEIYVKRFDQRKQLDAVFAACEGGKNVGQFAFVIIRLLAGEGGEEGGSGGPSRLFFGSLNSGGREMKIEMREHHCDRNRLVRNGPRLVQHNNRVAHGLNSRALDRRTGAA